MYSILHVRESSTINDKRLFVIKFLSPAQIRLLRALGLAQSAVAKKGQQHNVDDLVRHV